MKSKISFLASHERLQLFGGIFVFVIRVFSVIFCYGDVFSDAPAKGTFHTLTTLTLPTGNGENCSVDNLLYSVARP